MSFAGRYSNVKNKYNPGQTRLETFKERYNNMLTRYRDLEAYMEDEAVPYDTRLQSLKKVESLSLSLKQLIKNIKEAGYQITAEEIRKGF